MEGVGLDLSPAKRSVVPGSPVSSNALRASSHETLSVSAELDQYLPSLGRRITEILNRFFNALAVGRAGVQL